MSATAQLALDVRGFLAGMDLAKQGLSKFREESTKVDEGNGMARLQIAAIALAAGVAALGVSIYKGVASTIELGARLVDVSYKSGLAVEEIMALERSLDEVGGKAEDAAPSTDKFNAAIQQAANNAGPLAGILQEASISMQQLAGMSVAERMTAVGDAIRAIKNPAQQSEAAMATFGASGIKMLAALDPKNLNGAAAAMGSQAQIMQANAGVFARIMQLMGAQGSSLNSLAVAVKGKLQGLFTGIASGIAPTILKIMEASSTGGTSLAAAIRSFSPALEPLAALVESLVKMDLAGVGAKLGAGAAAIVEAIMNGDAINYLKAGLMVVSGSFRESMASVLGGIANAMSTLVANVDFSKIITGFETGMAGIAMLFVGIMQTGIAKTLLNLRQSSQLFANLVSAEMVGSLVSDAGTNKKAGKEAIATGKSDVIGGTQSTLSALAQNIANLPQAFADGSKRAIKIESEETAKARATMAEIEKRANKSAQTTAADLRRKFATPAKGEQAIGIKEETQKTQQPIASITSSMAKIGGDIGGTQTGAIDIARQQLQAQQRTADNTAKMVDKLSKLNTGGTLSAQYQ
jgi:hypothetical protein